jgi:kynureninase
MVSLLALLIFLALIILGFGAVMYLGNHISFNHKHYYYSIRNLLLEGVAHKFRKPRPRRPWKSRA